MASLTLERAKRNMVDCGIPVTVLAQVGGVRPTTLSSVFRGVMALHSETEARLLTISCRIAELHQAISPLRLPDGRDDVRRLVEQLESGAVTLEEIRTAVARMVGA